MPLTKATLLPTVGTAIAFSFTATSLVSVDKSDPSPPPRFNTTTAKSWNKSNCLVSIPFLTLDSLNTVG